MPALAFAKPLDPLRPDLPPAMALSGGCLPRTRDPEPGCARNEDVVVSLFSLLLAETSRGRKVGSEATDPRGDKPEFDSEESRGAEIIVRKHLITARL